MSKNNGFTPIIIDEQAQDARAYINTLLRGEVDSNVAPPDCGTWNVYLENLLQAYRDGLKHGGIAMAIKLVEGTLNVYRRSVPAIDFLMGGKRSFTDVDTSNLLIDAAPPLPDSAYLDPAGGNSARRWLDEYMQFSHLWSPRGHTLMHEGIGVWLLSAIAGRRIVIPIQRGKFTPLYVMIAAPSGLFTKTTTINVARDVLTAAGLDWLLLPKKMTPQVFYQIAAGHVPENYEALEGIRREIVDLQLAMAGKRAWIYEEFGGKLASLAQTNGIMRGFHEIMLEWEDCPDTDDMWTIGRGADRIETPYLSLLAVVTPENIASLPKGTINLWRDGFLARLAVVCPPIEDFKQEQWPDGMMTVPEHIWGPLRQLHERLGLPEIKITQQYNANNKAIPGKYLLERGPLPQHMTTLGKDVLVASQRYNDALVAMAAVRGMIHEELRGNYLRFGEKAMRVAALLAWMENGGRVEMEHWIAAQTIAEHWRASIHQFHVEVNDGNSSPMRKTEEKFMNIVTKLNMKGVWPRIYEITARTGISAEEANRCAENLQKAGMLVSAVIKGGKAGNRPVTIYGLPEASLPDTYDLYQQPGIEVSAHVVEHKNKQ